MKVCVIGGGIAGMSTALAVKDMELRLHCLKLQVTIGIVQESTWFLKE